MTSAAPFSPLEYQALVAAAIAGAERWIAEKETIRPSLTTVARAADADVRQARILIAYLRTKAAAAAVSDAS